MITYKKYKENVIESLNKGKTWEDGVYKYRGKELNKGYILPLENNENTPKNRAAALGHFVGLDCKKCLGENLSGLHKYAHHLISSQLLCMQFFSELVDNELHVTEKLVAFMKNAFGIEIHEGSQCSFEYAENKATPYMFDVDREGKLKKGEGFYEGTSFDFHIQDGETEVYFEIKFTEQGFKKEKRDGRHEVKAKQYLEIAPQFVSDLVKSEDDFLKQYQIYRNIIRATSPNKYVIFISDRNNPATNKDKEMMDNLPLPNNVKYTTWQEIIPAYKEIVVNQPFQLKVLSE